MKINNYLKLAITVLASAIAFQSPSKAQSISYVCTNANDSDNTPTTYIKKADGGSIPLFSWQSKYFPPPYTPMGRCQEVTERLNNFQSQGILKNFHSGVVRGYNVVCAGECYSDGSNIIYTLKPDQLPADEIQKLNAHKRGETTAALPQSNGALEQCTTPDTSEAYQSSLSINSKDGSFVFNLQNFIDTAPVDNCLDTTANSSSDSSVDSEDAWGN